MYEFVDHARLIPYRLVATAFLESSARRGCGPLRSSQQHATCLSIWNHRTSLKCPSSKRETRSRTGSNMYRELPYLFPTFAGLSCSSSPLQIKMCHCDVSIKSMLSAFAPHTWYIKMLGVIIATIAIESKRPWHEGGGSATRHLGDMLSPNNTHYKYSSRHIRRARESTQRRKDELHPNTRPSATLGTRHDASEVARVCSFPSQTRVFRSFLGRQHFHGRCISYANLRNMIRLGILS